MTGCIMAEFVVEYGKTTEPPQPTAGWMRRLFTATTSQSGRRSAAFSRRKAATFWKSAAAPASTPTAFAPRAPGTDLVAERHLRLASQEHRRMARTFGPRKPASRPSASISAILIGVGPATPTAMRRSQPCCASTCCTSRPGACHRICLQEQADSCESMAACLSMAHSGVMARIHRQATPPSMPPCGRRIRNGACVTCRDLNGLAKSPA